MNSVYDDYMRSFLGYEPINYRNTYEQDYNDYMDYQNYSATQQLNRNSEELEECYPDIYKLVYPMVQKACLQNTRNISKELIEEITEDIYFSIEDDNLNRAIEKQEIKNAENRSTIKTQTENKLMANKQESRNIENRQNYGNQRLRDLIKILILREFLNRPGFRPRPPIPPIQPMPPRPPRPPMRPGIGRPQFNRNIYDSNYELYEDNLPRY